MTRNAKLTLLAALSLAILGAVETPQAWPMGDGVTCYTYFGALSCTAAQAVATLPPTASPTATATQPPATATHTPTPTPVPPTATRTPTQTPTASPAPVIHIINGGFESGLTGWTQFNLNGGSDINSERISTGADPLAVHSGDASARLLSHYSCYRSGVYQVVGVPVGAHIRVSAWVMTLGSRTDGLHNPEPNMNSYIGLGVDPLGLTSAAVSRIEWARIVGGQLVGATHGLDPSWQLIQLETITARPTLTVFVYGDLGKTQDGACMWAYMNLLTFIDDIGVEVVP